MKNFVHASTRRELLGGAGVLFAWPFLPKVARAEGRDPRMLTIILRGALDGLAAVAPVGDPDWVKLRGDRALTLDGKPAALPLDSFFALNPAMPHLHRLYQAGHATIVHAAATPYRERSHFDGQDVLESGLAKPAMIDSGWLNRALVGLAPEGRVRSDTRHAFAVGPVAPLVVRGRAPVMSWVPQRLPPASDATLGPAWPETVVALVTEFGRTARINGTDGTDHGTATVALLVGGALKGGRVIADWPGLKDADLHEHRDLKATTDLRAVLKGLLKDHLRVDDGALATKVFPESAAVKPMAGLLA